MFILCLHNSFVIQKTVANSSGLETIKHLKIKDCFYTGEVVNHPSSTVAVSMCEGKMVCVFKQLHSAM